MGGAVQEGYRLPDHEKARPRTPDRFRLEAYPLPVRGGDAAPARVVAEW